MTPEQLTRAAELIDEGWITMHRTSAGKHVVIQVSAERLGNVQWLLQNVTGNLRRNGGLYWWSYGGKRAVVLLEEIVGLLRKRGPDALLAITTFKEENGSDERINMLLERNISRAEPMRPDQRPLFRQIWVAEMRERRLLRGKQSLEGR